MSAAQFPGHVYEYSGNPLTAEAPAISEALVDGFRYRGAVMAEEPDPDDEISAALVWILRDGSRFSDVPAAWVARAVNSLVAGDAVVLVADDAATQESIRDGLLDRLNLMDAPAAGMGRA